MGSISSLDTVRVLFSVFGGFCSGSVGFGACAYGLFFAVLRGAVWHAPARGRPASSLAMTGPQLRFGLDGGCFAVARVCGGGGSILGRAYWCSVCLSRLPWLLSSGAFCELLHRLNLFCFCFLFVFSCGFVRFLRFFVLCLWLLFCSVGVRRPRIQCRVISLFSLFWRGSDLFVRGSGFP